MKRWWLGIIILLILWAVRLNQLDLLPLHNDEGLHLTRAVEVWNGHPFWAISDGKIINHWMIAAFYPQHGPVFAGRIATIVVSMVGLAAAFALVKNTIGYDGAILTGALWITSPYLFFYERLAFSDAEAGALAVLAGWAALQTGGKRWRLMGVMTGLALAGAILLKFTATPFALSILLLILTRNNSRQQRMTTLGVVVITTGVCFVVPLGYLTLREKDFFSIALGWVSGSSAGQPSFFNNLVGLWRQLTGFGSLGWVILMLCGLLFLSFSRQRVLLTAGILPLLIMMLLGREVLSRHYVVGLPVLLTLGGAGLGLGLRRIRADHSRRMMAALGVTALAMGSVPFFLAAYDHPSALPLPDDVRYEHITSHSSGYGLREAVQSLSQIIARRDLPIIGSMFPDSCRRVNFYATGDLRLICADAPGIPEIEAALAERGAVYVLADNAPNIGVDVNILKVRATQVAGYPRPGEKADNASVVLWLLENPNEGSLALRDCTAQIAAVTLPAYAPSGTSQFVTLHDGEFWTGEEVYLVRGVNYYPAHYPWRRFLTQADAETIDRDFTLLRAAGFNTLRIFLWNDALFACRSAIPIVDAFARLDAVIQAAARQGLRLIVTLNDLSDLIETPLYTTPQSVQTQTALIIERYRDEAAILAWDLRNEGDIDYGSNSSTGGAFTREAVLGWLAETSGLVRELDKHHLITAGWLYDNASTAPYVDFVSLHHWNDAGQLRERIADIRSKTDKAILLEEFGYSTFRVPPETQSELILGTRQVAEEMGLLGWLIWTAFDFPLDATCIQPACPSADNAEHHFGLWEDNYGAKPVVEALLNLR